MNNCRICDGVEFNQILNLGHHPPSDAFLTEEQLKEPETYYPLNLVRCKKCGLVQIDYVVDPNVLFENEYPYVTGVNQGGIDHFRDFALDVIDKYNLDSDSFVVDIGGNDGTLLVGFMDFCGCRVLNVDPSGVESSVETLKMFFNRKVATQIGQYADVITATNVVAHCANLHELVSAVYTLLKDDGVFVIESPCLDDMLKYYQFDQIYHEHLSYFDTYPMQYLVGMHNMYLERVEHNDMHGGSNRYFVKKLCRKSEVKQEGFIERPSEAEVGKECDCGGECECQGEHTTQLLWDWHRLSRLYNGY